MASVSFGGGITKVVGSHGGNTFSANKGGSYVKSKPFSTNPASAAQSGVRVIIGSLSKYFTHTLTAAQQAAWRAFAAVNPTVNRLGNMTLLSGAQMFVKLNSPLQLHGWPIILAPPGSTAISTPTGVTIVPTSGGPGTLTINITTGAPAANEGGYLSFTMPVNPGVTHCSSYFRHCDMQTTLNAATNVTAAYLRQFGLTPSSAGQKIFVRAQILNHATGVLSTAFQTTALWL